MKENTETNSHTCAHCNRDRDTLPEYLYCHECLVAMAQAVSKRMPSNNGKGNFKKISNKEGGNLFIRWNESK